MAEERKMAEWESVKTDTTDENEPSLGTYLGRTEPSHYQPIWLVVFPHRDRYLHEIFTTEQEARKHAENLAKGNPGQPAQVGRLVSEVVFGTVNWRRL
jgi:hypothetical protein